METETQGFSNCPRALSGGARVSRWYSQDWSAVRLMALYPERAIGLLEVRCCGEELYLLLGEVMVNDGSKEKQ